jgi:hypothetical protein
MQQILQERKLSEIVRNIPYRQIKNALGDLMDGRCVIGGIMCYCGWDGKDYWSNNALEIQTRVLDMVGGTEMWQVLVDKNNSGESFEMMADWLESIGL